MKKNIILVTALLITVILSAQEGWRQLENAPASEGRIDDIFFLPSEEGTEFDIGWAANGPSGNVYKTTDGGENWDFIFAHNGYNRNIEFIDENIGFIGTLDGVFYKTGDGGLNWEIVNISPNPEAICGLDAVNDQLVYGCGAWFEPAYIIKSTDAGNNWDYMDMSAYADALVEILFIDEDHGFTSGKGPTGGVILETFDGGETWALIHNTGVPGDYVWKMQLMDNNQTIFGSVSSNSNGKLIKSFDAGATWESKSVPDNAVQAVGFINSELGWMGGHGSNFLETTNGGDTWEDIGIGSNLNRFFIINSSVAYGSGNSVYKFDGEKLGISNFDSQKQEDLAVRIAPLPVKDRLEIEIDFIHKDNVFLELYDASGKRLTKLHRDRIFDPGTRKYSFEFHYPAGTYLLDIQSNNGRRSYTIVKN